MRRPSIGRGVLIAVLVFAAADAAAQSGRVAGLVKDERGEAILGDFVAASIFIVALCHAMLARIANRSTAGTRQLDAQSADRVRFCNCSHRNAANHWSIDELDWSDAVGRAAADLIPGEVRKRAS